MRISGRFSSSGFHAKEELRFDNCGASLLALIHPSAWNRNSANFALTEFSEVQQLFRTRM
jgi:hypothetical protein